MPSKKHVQPINDVFYYILHYIIKLIPVTHRKSTALPVRSPGIVLKEHQPRLIMTEYWVANRMISRTKCCTSVILQVDVEESATPLCAVDTSQTIRHVPPTNTDYSEVIRTPDGLTGRHVLRQVL